MKNLWIHKSGSFKKAEDFNKKYYLNMSPSERLDIVQFLREKHFNMRGYKNQRKGLQRSIRIIEMK